MYKTDLHCHTREMTPSCHEDGTHAVDKFIAQGYNTLVITNHGTDKVFNRILGEFTWEEKLDKFFAVTEELQKYAGDRLHIIPGMEITFRENGNDYLAYGVTKEKLMKCPDMLDMGISNFHKFAKENDILVIQAHPMRFWTVTIPPDEVDGYEIFNGNRNDRSHNEVADLWARHFYLDDLIYTSGSDSHFEDEIPEAGILTEEPITNSDELLSVLRSKKFGLLRHLLGETDY